jgi:hypothetical protein
MQMQASSTKPSPAAELVGTSTSWKKIILHDSMVPFSLLPYSSSSSWHLPLNLAALFITAREMIPHHQTHIAMGWPQPKCPIQTDNSTAVGVTNKNIVPCRAKIMDMQFWWLRCCASQDQFCCYWDAGSKNWADHTKHHPDTYHKAH